MTTTFALCPPWPRFSISKSPLQVQVAFVFLVIALTTTISPSSSSGYVNAFSLSVVVPFKGKNMSTSMNNAVQNYIPLFYHQAAAARDVVTARSFSRSRGLHRRTGPTNSLFSYSALRMNWFTSSSEKNTNTQSSSKKSALNRVNDDRTIIILDKIGSGSYGTVHYCQFVDNGNVIDGSGKTFYVAKRAWTFHELKEFQLKRSKSTPSSSDDNNDINTNDNTKKQQQQEEKQLRERAKRCQHYLNVEEHCFQKMKNANRDEGGAKGNESTDTKPIDISNIPNFVGRFNDNGEEEEGREWLVFELITSTSQGQAQVQKEDDISPPKAAKSLHHAMFLDWKDQHTQEGIDRDNDGNDNSFHHHLYMIQKELGMNNIANSVDCDGHDNNDSINNGSTFEDTLDVIMLSLLKVLVDIHKQNIVHRDLKPDNLLLDGSTQSLVLIDFGSAADMDPIKSIGGFGKRIGLDDTIVAISPIYSAPETFVKLGQEALAFDVFSAGLIFCQLLFNLLDERTDAAFRQQLEEANYDLDIWIERELQSTIRPAGFDDGMLYLAERVGLWRLLKAMLVPDPLKRISSFKALTRFEEIQANLASSKIVSREEVDGKYFDSVISNFELCSFGSDDDAEKENVEGGEVLLLSSDLESDLLSQNDFVIPRPLHFIATFERSKSLGLILSEFEIDDEDDEEYKSTREEWDIATEKARKGEVFVRHILEGGQADEMGIIEIGDRLVGVNEFPFFSGGFGGFLQMLDSVPERAKNVKIHFDRQTRLSRINPGITSSANSARISSQGAWSTKGRRKQNEDRLILQEIHDQEMHSILVAGVFDGHGGEAASKTASQILPSLLSTQVPKFRNLSEALQSAWDSTCDTYQEGCSLYGECVAEYDPREGVLVAGTGSKDLIAGTTAAVAVLSTDGKAKDLTVLNCGDSRTLIVGEPKEEGTNTCLHFVTKDHSPSCKSERERLRLGKEKGLDYSEPECSVNRWRMRVGDYQYSVSRSLEGQFATSKGITPEADITTLNIPAILEQRNDPMMIIASDGLFEVLDNELVGKEALKMRRSGLSAKDTAKQLCSFALDKYSSDNISAVVVYFE